MMKLSSFKKKLNVYLPKQPLAITTYQDQLKSLDIRIKGIMTCMFLCFVAIILVSSPVLAGKTNEQQSGLCAEDSTTCRSFAIEIAKANVREAINKAQYLAKKENFLCPENNQQCCPPHLQDMCMTFQDTLIAGAKAQLQQSTRSNDRCPLPQEFCDALGGFYCKAGESYTPWNGCTSLPGIVDPTPPLPPICPPGKRPNSKGLCVPEPCYDKRTGLLIPCIFTPDNQVLAQTFQTRNFLLKPILIRHLNNKKIQLKAANQVRDDLKEAIKFVDEQIKQLSHY